MLLNKLIKSVLQQDKAPIVICDLEHKIVYMNPVAIERYHKDLTGLSLKKCHNEKSSELIDKVVSWFRESAENNIVYTYNNEKENKDVYMIALRDENGELIGYYEKHEYRNKEKGKLYDI
ncbi:MAG: PAS domain-containing protein [Ruminococcaceae bacterium]|nr:PAS domain-containing protein [Oscillospiraceae bacterium]